MDDFTCLVAAQRLLPVLRAPDASAAVRRVAELVQAGCRVVELTTTTQDWPRALADCRALHGATAMIGIGTVTEASQAQAAVEGGAAFLVSPYPAPQVRAVAERAGVVFVEGGYTPGEIAEAARRGPAKVFPAHVGGPAFIRSLLTVLPQARLIPTGGIGAGQVADYLGAGALAVGVGSGLPDDPAALADLFRQASELNGDLLPASVVNSASVFSFTGA
jgi:2-dehydro-3-deoxyphosphogluconate aldolase / (4S)-4-hydroxy-2-oxoglutarate aldolase